MCSLNKLRRLKCYKNYTILRTIQLRNLNKIKMGEVSLEKAEKVLEN